MWLRPKSICLSTFVNDACQAQSESKLIHWAYCLQSPAVVQLQKGQATGRRRYSVLWPENWAVDRTYLPHAASSTRASFIFDGKGGVRCIVKIIFKPFGRTSISLESCNKCCAGSWWIKHFTIFLKLMPFLFGVSSKRKSEGLMIYYWNAWLIGKPCDTVGNLVILTIVLWTINGRKERKEITGASCYCRPWNQYVRRPLTRLALHPLSTDLRLSVDMTTGHCVWRTTERNKKAAARKEPSRGFPPLHCSWSADPSSCPTS